MSETFFISDTHFWHSRICLYSSRPFSSVEEMNEAMIVNWNDVVEPNDDVYHLGDFAFCSRQELQKILTRLNGNIHVILGNHDRVLIENRQYFLNLGKIKSIQNYRELRVNKNFIVLFHYGQRVWNKSHHGSIQLYGHSHGSLPPYGKSVDVGVDCKEITPEYRPIHLDEVLAYMANRQSEVVDHHGM